MKMKYILLCLLAVLLLPGFAAARQQGITQDITLAEALNRLSKHYGVNFIYEDQTVKDKVISGESGLFAENTIAKVLNRILPPLGLSWFQIDDKNYTIYPVRSIQKTSGSTRKNQVLGRGFDSLRKGDIKGLVFDEDHRPLQFATIQLIKAGDLTVIAGALCDTSGEYHFNAVAPGAYQVKVAMMGYQTAVSAVFNLTGNGVITVEPLLVHLLTKNLKEVKITGSRPLVERKSDRFIVNVAGSPMATGNSLQALRSAPFVEVSPDNEVSLQGKKTMILVDGKPLPDASLADILQALPAGDIATIELITNPSAKYDATYGAVINIITKKDPSQGLTGNIRAEYTQGNLGRSNLNGRLSYKLDHLTLFGTGGFSHFNYQTHDDTYRELYPGSVSDLIHEQIVRTFHSNSGNFQVGGNLDITSHQSIGALIAGRFSDGTTIFNSVDAFSRIGRPLDYVLITKSPIHPTTRGFDYNLNYHLVADSGKSELTVLTTLSPLSRLFRQSFTSVLEDGNGNITGIPDPYQYTNSYRFLIFVAQADYSRALSRGWKLETGIKYEGTDSKQTIDFTKDTAGTLVTVPQNSSNSQLTEAIVGVYGLVSKKWKTDALRLGLRMENTNDRYVGFYTLEQMQFFPSLLFEHDFSQQDNLTLSYRRTVQRAPYGELVPYRLIINPFNIGLGNPLLKPQFNNEFSVNAKLHALNISLNYSSIQGLIAQTPESEDFADKITYIYYQNLAQSRNIFIDVFYPLQISPWWNTQNSGTLFGYSKSSGIVLGQPFSVSGAKFSVRSNQTFKLSGSIKLEIDGYYNSSRADGLTHNGGYGNMDAGLLISMFKGKGQLKLGGQEILRRNIYFTSQDFGVYSTHRNRYFDNRAATVSFTYNFGRDKVKTPAKKLGNEDALGRSN